LESAPKVLVIDDEEAARYGVTRALASQGYRLEEAADGVAALAKIGEFQPDVIVSDINMPGMNGLSLLRHVNQGPTAPLVVLMTAYGSEHVAAEALRAGAYDYLSKPFEIDELRVVVRNAIEKQSLRRELQQSQTALLQAEKMASLGRLVAGVAHEINTPLGALQSNNDTIERVAGKIREWLAGQPPEAQAAVARYVDALAGMSAQSQAACERIGGIVTNLRQFARLDEAEFQRAQVRDGIESALGLLRQAIGADVEVIKEFGELPEIECAPRQLNQLFMNLLENAIEAARAAGRPGVIRIRTRAEADAVKVEVEDNGCGIPAENLKKIFDPGFTTKGVRVGTGLGLPICYQIAQTHGGRLEVESRVEAGSKFTLTLPIRRRG